ncbi:hypothetical protein O0L34_g15401 [Tuta absoluta]|nr:hypothetical protein O0L34_g15401 [Tuta absoluta]
MVVKLVVLSCLVAAAAAVTVPDEATIAVQAPIAAKLIYQEQEIPAQYEYEYSIQDPQSGDDKSAKENRSGDDVQGYYSFVQPDGVRRIVEYTSSKEHGFNAVVRYEGTPVATKLVAQAPVAYAAPVAKVAYAPAPTQVAYVQRPAPIAYAQPVAYAPAPQKIAYALAPTPAAYAGAPVQKIAYAPAPTQVTYAQVSQPQYTYTQGPVVHAQPVAKVAYPSAQVAYAPSPAQVAYAQVPSQVAYAQAPVAYAQPVGKITYSPAASVGHFSYASPVVSYKH